MAHHRLLKPHLLVLLPLVLLLIVAVACGGDADPTPTTSAPSGGAANPTPTATQPPAPGETPEPTATGMAPAPGETPGPTPTAMAQPTPTTPSVQAAYGGTVNMNDYAFPNLDMHPHRTLTQVKNFSGIYNGLMEYDPSNTDYLALRCDLCTSWETEDGVTFIFHLHEGITWHDGTPFTAEDVVYSMDSLVLNDPENPRPITRDTLQTYYSPGNTVAIDDTTVQLTANFAAGDFFPALAIDPMKMIAKHWEQSDIDHADWNNAMGTGPFLPGEFIKDTSIELVKNPDYFKDGLPYIDRMVHFTILDLGTVKAAYRTEQVLTANWGITNLDVSEMKRFAEEEKDILTVWFMPPSASRNIIFNSGRAPFDKIEVKQAINLALHRQPFAELFDWQIGTPLGAGGVWFSKTPEEIAQLPGWRELDGEKHPDDIAEAKRLLESVGLGDGFEAEMMVRTSVGYPDQAALFAEQLEKFLNIKLNLNLVDSATGFDRYEQGDWTIAPQGFGPLIFRPDVHLTLHWLTGGIVARWTNWEAPQWWVDDFNTQARTLDQDERKAILTRMENYLLDTDPGTAAVIGWVERTWPSNNKLKGMYGGNLWTRTKHETIWCDGC